MQAVTPFVEAIDIVKEAGGEALESCYQCGLCSGTCPWNLVRSFIVRRLIHQAQLGLADFESEETWTCSTCGACVARCPRGVEIIDVIRSLRRTIIGLGAGYAPDSLRMVLKNIAAVGNPLGEEREKRADWAEGLGVKDFTPEMELLYSPGCIPAYDPKVQRVARATAAILQKAGIDFGILGAEESCCGESVRKAGNEALFQSLAQSNINAFAARGVRRSLTISPHCFYTFKNEYPQLGGNFEAIHYTVYFAQLIREGRLSFTRELNKRVAYHDPCYLGRHSGIYDEPREVLGKIPGIELVELPDFRENSLCCGGGGGRIWTEAKKGERLSDLRIEQAIGVGAEILVVSCPYCLLNFEDSVLTMDKEEVLQIRDISELVQEAI
jgi:Fe-S oxidoreductase